MAMRRWGTPGSLLVLSLCLLAVAGCDSASFVPPPPSGLRPDARPVANGARSSSAAKNVVMILPAEESSDLAVWETVARQEAGLRQVGFTAVRPTPFDPSKGQAELIREAARTASALIVVTDRSPETTAALAALSPTRTKVVLLGRELPDSPEARKVPAVLVATPAPSDTAKQLVASAAKAARDVPGGSKGTPEVVLVRSAIKDETSEARAKALVEAIKAAGLNLAADEQFDGTIEDVNKLVARVAKEHPKVSVLICVEEMALSGVASAQESVMPKVEASSPQAKPREPSLADNYKTVGYVSSKSSLNLARIGKCVALADRNIQGMARKAIQTSVELLDGLAIAPKVEVEMSVVEAKAR